MNAFRGFLVALFVVVTGYTAVILWNYGFTLFPVFFGDIADMTWRGQFNMDFTCFLAFSGLWLAWRHHFSPAGLALGGLGFFGGAPVLSVYLFFASLAAKDDVAVLFLGKARAARG